MQNAKDISPINYYKSSKFSSFVKKFEKKRIDDELKKLCSRCFYAEQVHGISPRLEANQKLDNPEKLKTIKENFVMKKMNKNYLFRDQALEISILGNKCNLRCYSCSAENSSSIAAERRLHNDDLASIPLDWDVRSRVGEKNHLSFWKELGELLKNTRFISVAGGEPFLMDSFEEILDLTMASGGSKEISLSISTNGTVGNIDRRKRIVDKLLHFKSVILKVSVDGFEEKNHYIRYPSQWESIVENIEFFKNNNSNIKLQLSTTISALSIDSVIPLNKFCRENGIEHYVGNILYRPSFQQIRHLPDPIKKKLSEDFRNFSGDQYAGLVNALEKSRDETEWVQLLIYLKKLDSWRGTDFRDLWPEFSQFQAHC